MLKDLIRLPEVKVLNEVDLESVLDFWPQRLPDFGDAFMASACRSNKGAVAATVDRKLISILKKSKIPVASL